MLDNAGYEDISPDEETSFNNKQFNELLLKLEKDLKILKDDLGEDLIEHFKELEELKKTATFSIINIEDVTSFIHTNIFALMIELPEAFSFKLLTIYECMLKCVGYFPKKAYREHLQLLLDLKTDETKDLLLLINDKRKKQQSFLLNAETKQQVSIRPFFSILSEIKTKKRGNSENVETTSKRKQSRKISPLALPNNLDNQFDDEYQTNLLQSMKLF